MRIIKHAHLVHADLVAKTSSSVQPAPAEGAQSACDQLAGTVDTDKVCHVQASTPTYKLDFRFPVDYPDQQSLTHFLAQRRNEFVDWVAKSRPMEVPYEFDVIGKAYHSGTPTSGTQSLVLTIGSDTGVHPSPPTRHSTTTSVSTPPSRSTPCSDPAARRLTC